MNTQISIADELKAAERQVIVDLGPKFRFTRGQLTKAFNRVADRKNWKAAVDKRVTIRTSRERIAILVAVEFFTGSKPCAEIVELRGPKAVYHIRAAGYYAAVGA